MILRFSSGSETQGSEESFGLVGHHQVHSGDLDEILLDLFGLPLTQESVVDEDTGQLRPDGPLHQRRGDGRVHTSGQRTKHPAVPHLGADVRDGLVDHVLGGPVGGQPRDVEQEVFQHLLTPLGVRNLRVPLHPRQFPHPALECCDRGARRARQHMETLRGAGNGIPVAHPHIERVREGRQEFAAVLDGQGRATVLALPRLGHRPAQGLGHRLEAVADPENRDSGLEQRRIDLRGVIGIDRRRPARQDDGRWPPGQDLLHGGLGTDDLRVDVGFTDPPGDELRVLGAEVDHEYQIVLGSHERESRPSRSR